MPALARAAPPGPLHTAAHSHAPATRHPPLRYHRRHCLQAGQTLKPRNSPQGGLPPIKTRPPSTPKQSTHEAFAPGSPGTPMSAGVAPAAPACPGAPRPPALLGSARADWAAASWNPGFNETMIFIRNAA